MMERSIDGPSKALPPGFLLTNLSVEPWRQQLFGSVIGEISIIKRRSPMKEPDQMLCLFVSRERTWRSWMPSGLLSCSSKR